MASILVVCTGNVCRSPLAEGFLRHVLDARSAPSSIDVTSAGTMGWEGSAADRFSVEAGAERGIDISGPHRAELLDERRAERRRRAGDGARTRGGGDP